MHAEVTQSERPEERIREGVRHHIAIARRFETPGFVDDDTGQTDRTAAAEPMGIEPPTNSCS